LRGFDYTVTPGIGKTGVVALKKHEGRDGRCVLLRADMDALPVEEANDVPYRSRHSGKMHACGHDGHVAIGLEVARAAVWRAAWASDHPEAFADRSLPDLPLQSIAEAFAPEVMLRAVKDAAECFGAMGVMRDMPLHKYVHDARVCLHSGEGSSGARLHVAAAITE